MKKRILSIFLTLGIMLGVLTPLATSAVAAGEKIRLYPAGATNEGGHRYNHGTSTSGTGVAMIDVNGKVNNRAWGYIDPIHIGSYSGPIAYCIQMGTALGSGDYIAEDTTFNDLWQSNLSATARRYISMVTMYGYPNFSYGAHWVDAYAATQCLIWEFSINFRTSPNGFNNPNGYAGDQIYNLAIKGHPAEAVYNQILSEIKAHETIPDFASSNSFASPVHEMNWNNSTGRHEYTVPTSQIGNYQLATLPAGVGVEVSDSDTVFYTTSDVDENSGIVTMKKNLPEPPQNLLLFNSPSAQACVAGTAEDPVRGYFKLKSEILGQVNGLKVGEDGKGLPGAVIGLFKTDTDIFTKDSASLTTTSTDDGTFEFFNVPYNEIGWVVREITAPKGYVLSEKSYPVIIAGHGDVINITMENTLIRGSVRTTKVDSEYPDHKLTGARFDVFADVNENEVYDEGVDTYAGSLAEMEEGEYQLNELAYSGYFLSERIAPLGFVLDSEYYYFKIENDGETVTVENNAGIGFTNEPIMGELWLTKKDVSTGMLIPNCGIRIKDKNGNIIAEDRTDENGFVKFTLKAGQYTYSEFDCEGYELDPSEFPFEITESRQIIRAVMTNKKLSSFPKTGDESGMVSWLILLGVSATAFIVLSIYRNRRKKETNK